MPVLNGEKHIAEQLSALTDQTYSRQWELVVVDNGCTDRSMEIVHSFAPRLPSVRVADASDRRGINHARNVGATAARGDFLVFCDADDAACPGWLDAMAQAAAHADVVGGRLAWERLNDPIVRAWRPQSPMNGLRADHGFLPYAPGGNMGVWTQIAHQIGWDERFTFGSSDFGFAWRAQLAGYRLVFAPEALMHQRYRDTLRATAWQQFRYGRSGPHVHRAYRHLGVSRADNRRAVAIWRGLLTNVPDLWHSPERRGKWIRIASFRLGRLEGCLRARVLCL